jgi:hypothetical protein
VALVSGESAGMTFAGIQPDLLHRDNSNTPPAIEHYATPSYLVRNMYDPTREFVCFASARRRCAAKLPSLCYAETLCVVRNLGCLRWPLEQSRLGALHIGLDG